MADELGDEFTVVTYDLRGTGGSERAAGPYSLDDFVGDLRALAEDLELARPALVGHSFGGSIALAYAARYPADVSAVVSVGGPVVAARAGAARACATARRRSSAREWRRSRRRSRRTERRRPSGSATRPSFEALVAMLAANDPAAYAATCRVLAGPGPRGRSWAASRRRCSSSPATATAWCPPAAGDEIEAALPNVARRVTVEDCGHNLTVERPEVLVDEVRSFLRGRIAAQA